MHGAGTPCAGGSIASIHPQVKAERNQTQEEEEDPQGGPMALF